MNADDGRLGDLYPDGIEFNIASIPSDVCESRDEPFDRKYIIALFDRGYDLASRDCSWVRTPPGMELVSQAPD